MSSCKHYKRIISSFTCVPAESAAHLNEGKLSCSRQNKGFYFCKHWGLPDLGTTIYNLRNEGLTYLLHTKDIFHFCIQTTFNHPAEVAINKYHIDGFTVFLCNLSSRPFILKVVEIYSRCPYGNNLSTFFWLSIMLTSHSKTFKNSTEQLLKCYVFCIVQYYCNTRIYPKCL